MSQQPNPVRDKSYAFALAIIALHRDLILSKDFDIGRQILKSGTSVGANIREGLQGQSRKDFISKFSIALKEAHESMYWLLLIRDSHIKPEAYVLPFIQKANELIRLLTAILKTSRS